MIDNLVAPPVASNLRQPIATVVFRHPAVAWASVPETAVNEKHEQLLAENEIWVASEALASPPSMNSMLFEDLDQSKLG
jgi:hypothetical protein